MVFSKVFAPLFAMALAAVVNASPAASSEVNALSGIAKRTCTQTYTVVSGDTCSAIESKTGVSDAQLHQLNPGINSGCTNLQIGQVLCLSSGSGCSQTYTVVSGDTCSAIESKTGVSDAQLHSLNPAINSGCTNLQIGQVLCVSGGSGGGSGGTTLGPFTGSATYYDPNGGTGACPPYPVINNWDMAVAIGSGHWDGGAHCGKTMTVTYGSTTISVVVKDLCPGCQGANGIDLTEGAMAAMDPNYIAHGVDTVQWSI
ncbi:hypothetical protein MVEN_02296800 [Mycena venus]|uniref:LysM domain-containing protein n=1 Tax=Mycena venus TaxID=2733690 RepID=A0A8H7CGJ6_9AGAR|nr:hypothetical protein MVEN_02296800 [Mycena venus]